MSVSSTYNLQELLNNMPNSLAELARKSGIAERTLLRMRDGSPVQRKTANKVLHALSEIYDTRLTLSNVDGIKLE